MVVYLLKRFIAVAVAERYRTFHLAH